MKYLTQVLAWETDFARLLIESLQDCYVCLKSELETTKVAVSVHPTHPQRLKNVLSVKALTNTPFIIRTFFGGMRLATKLYSSEFHGSMRNRSGCPTE